MPTQLNFVMKLKGDLFADKNVVEIVRKAATEEAIDKVTERIMLAGKTFTITGEVKRNKRTGRQTKGRGLGVMRNTLEATRKPLRADISSTKIAPRTVGSAWVKYNLGIAKSMLPRVMNKTAARIVREMGGGETTE